MVRHVSLISQLKNLFSRSRKRGKTAKEWVDEWSRSTVQRAKFRRWYAQPDERGGWRVVDEGHVVVCNGCKEQDAKRIMQEHNKLNPVKSYEDWLYDKAPS